MRRLVIGLVAAACTLAPLPVRAAQTGEFLVHPDARAHYALAGEYAEKGDLSAAASELDATYAIEPHPELLFIRAELRRKLGECGPAVGLYEDFLASRPSEAATRQAREGIAECGPQPTEAKPEPPPVLPQPEPPAQPKRPWHRDPAGATLLAFGVAGIVAAGALAGPAVIERDLARESDTGHDQHIQTAIALQWSAGAAGVVGAALVIGAALRYRAVKRRQARISGWFDGFGAGVAVVGRF